MRRGRPPRCRLVAIEPGATVFKPRGIPARELEIVALGLDELEALRLADVVGLDHAHAGRLMGVSRPTFGRIVAAARRKVATALVEGKGLVLEGGNVMMREGTRHFECTSCSKVFEEPHGTGRPEACPHCGGRGFRRVAEERGSGPCRGRGHGRPCTGKARRRGAS